MKRYVILFYFISLSIWANGLSSQCVDALKDLFQNQITKEEAGEFLKVQADITLHRLAWSYLQSQKNDNTEKQESVESTILSLLDQKYNNTDPVFVKARSLFEAQPLSRTALSEMAPYLIEIFQNQTEGKNQAFKLSTSDVKVLHILSLYERENVNNNRYDEKMLNAESGRGVLNFLKLINSSYKTSLNQSEDALQVDIKINSLEATLLSLQEKVKEWLSKLDIPIACKADFPCEQADFGFKEIFENNKGVEELLWKTLNDSLESDEVVYKNLTYGKIWLKTKQKSPVQSIVVPKMEKTQVYNTSKPNAPFYTNSGIYIKNPIETLIKANPKRSKNVLETFDPKFIQKASDAVVSNDKIFNFNGHIYSSETMKSISLDNAFSYLPPSKAQALKTLLQSLDPKLEKFKTLLVMANVNKKSSFIYNGELYDLNGKKLNPAKVIAYETNLKKGTNREEKDYAGMEKLYLVTRANAIKNNQPHFVVDGEVFDTETGRGIQSPNRNLSSTVDVKIEKEQRKIYENLNDEELVINFHRDRVEKDGCQYYTIIDKKNAVLRIYHVSGVLKYETKILLGSKLNSDKKTVWTDYSDLEKLSNKSTGAGVYTIGSQKKGGYYQSVYNNNLFDLLDIFGKSQVMAIHQIPLNLQSRYNNIESDNVGDRRITGGCVNLKENDFLTIKNFVSPGCKVYILPEEPGNYFVVRNNKINFASDNPIPQNELKFYPFETTKKPSPIKIDIVNPKGITEYSTDFVKTLEAEKPKLMKALNLDNDDYNDLAMVAYAIMGNETKFGSSPKLWYKEGHQNQVVAAKFVKAVFTFKNPFSDDVLTTSRGLTQIKFLPTGKWQEEYPGVQKSFFYSTLSIPSHSAVATMAYLADALKTIKLVAQKNHSEPLTPQMTRETLIDYLAYIYTGRPKALDSKSNPATPDFNTYVQKLKLHMSYIEVSQRRDELTQ